MANPIDRDGDGLVFDGTKKERPAVRRAREVASAVAGDVAAPFKAKAGETTVQRTVRSGLQALARVEQYGGGALRYAAGVGSLPGGLAAPGDVHAAADLLDAYAEVAGLEARAIGRTFSSPARRRVFVRRQIRWAKGLLGLAKADGVEIDDDTLALMWLVREGIASPAQSSELQGRLQ